MSYLVLARKWRPKFFSEVSGQDHVVKPLQNSLNKDKVHHAFLFTGTRGVGKTTIARLLAKALNCENGVTSEPCGKCQPCTSIDDGNFIDLIEVDAASQRGIDDTRELLENSQYTPSTGRYKVYLIDEVHQLTKEAFNALLKTLEEPPPHMKFLLATTESEKIPITVLSRCLKFNLKKISEDTIQQRMIDICKKEKIKYEDNALGLISQASDGSMRDGLSLLDQALAYGDYNLTTEHIENMLGTIDINYSINLLVAIFNQDKEQLHEGLKEVDELYPDYSLILNSMASLLQEIAFKQVTDKTDKTINLDIIESIAMNQEPDLIQLLYQIAITSKRDMEIAPSMKEGFRMSILRMFSFSINEEVAPIQTLEKKTVKIQKIENGSESQSKNNNNRQSETKPKATTHVMNSKTWPNRVNEMNINGTVRQLASHCSLESIKDQKLLLTIDTMHEHHLSTNRVDALKNYLISNYDSIKSVDIALKSNDGRTLAKKRSEANEEQKIMNQSRVKTDPNLQQYMELFDAKIDEES